MPEIPQFCHARGVPKWPHRGPANGNCSIYVPT